MSLLRNRIADDETSLIRRALKGDGKAKYEIYQKYVRYLSAICSRYISDDEDVRDILQDAFLKIFSSLQDFRYQGQGSLKAWMGKIVLNESLKFLRKNSKMTLVGLSDKEDILPDEDSLSGNPAADDIRTDDIPSSEIHRMIRELPDGYRAVFNLYVIEGLSHREIASRLGIREASSASQLHRAKALLATKIREWHKNQG
ncbi:MAG: sigma-70 family RNA polymerase sigma factor [Bacteroidales bacterium]|nr:sigma-70 family RNA polymerase sigma factor [Bacteroidales bacterium]